MAPQYTLIPGSAYHDLLVEVEFAEPIDAAQTIPLLRLICDEVEGRIAALLELYLQGIAALHCAGQRLQLVLRLTPTDQLPGVDAEDCLHRRVHFMLYLFARIDTLYPLAATPFPADFRAWLAINEEYGFTEDE